MAKCNTSTNVNQYFVLLSRADNDFDPSTSLATTAATATTTTQEYDNCGCGQRTEAVVAARGGIKSWFNLYKFTGVDYKYQQCHEWKHYMLKHYMFTVYICIQYYALRFKLLNLCNSLPSRLHIFEQ